MEDVLCRVALGAARLFRLKPPTQVCETLLTCFYALARSHTHQKFLCASTRVLDPFCMPIDCGLFVKACIVRAFHFPVFRDNVVLRMIVGCASFLSLNSRIVSFQLARRVSFLSSLQVTQNAVLGNVNVLDGHIHHSQQNC